FRRGNVPFVLAATFRARLFLFPVDCSLFPLYYPLLFHQQLDKSEFECDRSVWQFMRSPWVFPQFSLASPANLIYNRVYQD
ncbi:MAG: hypothetical protein IJI59_12340, partial [Clostridia bacterium]|nr:hypothetical protein [Clostridia bacterium]